MDLKNVIVSAFTRLRTSNLGRGCDYEDLSPDKKRQKRGKERREKEEKKKKERKKKGKHEGAGARREVNARQLHVVEGGRTLILNPG